MSVLSISHMFFKSLLSVSNERIPGQLSTIHHLAFFPSYHISGFLPDTHNSIVTARVLQLTKSYTSMLLYYKKTSCPSYFLYEVPVPLRRLLCLAIL